MSFDDIDRLVIEIEKFDRKEIRECPVCGKKRPMTQKERTRKFRARNTERLKAK